MEIFMKKRPVREKLPAGRPQKWTQEFMLMVAKKVVDHGMTYRDASKTFEVSSGALSKGLRAVNICFSEADAVLNYNPEIFCLLTRR